jgi:hypothetical protein
MTEPAQWFLDNFELNGYVDIENGKINVHGSCRLRPSTKITCVQHEFGVVTGNFSLRGAGLTSLENMPKDVGGVAAFSWTPDTPMLQLLFVPYDFIVLDENARNIEGSTSTTIKRYRNKIRSGEITNHEGGWQCIGELVNNGFEGNAKW